MPRRPHVHVLAGLLVCAFASTAVPARCGAEQAPPFVLKTLDGHALRLSEMRNRPIVLDFWATWCAPCRAAMPHFNDLQARYASKGLAIVGLSVDENGPAPVKRYAASAGVKFAIVMANDDVLDAYGPIRAIPTTIFINRKGEIVRRVVGLIDSETLDGYVQEIVQP